MAFDEFSACFASKKVQYRKELFKKSEIYDCHEHSSGTYSPRATAGARHAHAAARAGDACSSRSAAHAGGARNVCSACSSGTSRGSHADARGSGCDSRAAASRHAHAAAGSSPGISAACRSGSSRNAGSSGSSGSSASSCASGCARRYSSPSAPGCPKSSNGGIQTRTPRSRWLYPEGRWNGFAQDLCHRRYARCHRADRQAGFLRRGKEADIPEDCSAHQTCRAFAANSSCC